MELIIGRAAKENIPQILEIYNHSIIHTTSVYRDTPHELAWMEEWFQLKRENDFPVLVAKEDSEIAGFASYGQFRSWPGYVHTVEHSIHVHPNHRRKGIASKLLENLLEEARKQNLHAMIGGIDAANAASIELHEKLGFKTVGILPEVGRKFDRWLDLQFMQILL